MPISVPASRARAAASPLCLPTGRRASPCRRSAFSLLQGEPPPLLLSPSPSLVAPLHRCYFSSSPNPNGHRPPPAMLTPSVSGPSGPVLLLFSPISSLPPERSSPPACRLVLELLPAAGKELAPGSSSRPRPPSSVPDIAAVAARFHAREKPDEASASTTSSASRSWQSAAADDQHNQVIPSILSSTTGLMQRLIRTVCEVVHFGGHELGTECCEVAVDYIIKRGAILPRSIGNVTTMGHAQGRSIAWLYKYMEVAKSKAKQSLPPQGE